MATPQLPQRRLMRACMVCKNMFELTPPKRWDPMAGYTCKKCEGGLKAVFAAGSQIPAGFRTKFG